MCDKFEIITKLVQTNTEQIYFDCLILDRKYELKFFRNNCLAAIENSILSLKLIWLTIVQDNKLRT